MVIKHAQPRWLFFFFWSFSHQCKIETKQCSTLWRG
jgi:hypothetical protein